MAQQDFDAQAPGLQEEALMRMSVERARVSDPLAVSFEQAAENHRRDALAMSHAQRWQWLAQAMDLGFSVARSRASRGLPSVDANGQILRGTIPNLLPRADHE